MPTVKVCWAKAGGRGIVDHFDLHGRVHVEVGTLSKAFGVVRGLVAGHQTIVDWLRQRGRPFLFSSAMTVPDVAACIESVNVLQESTELVDQLWRTPRSLSKGWPRSALGHSQTPIVPYCSVKPPSNFHRPVFRKASLPWRLVILPCGKARVRAMNSAAHSRQDLEQALDVF